MVSISKHYDLLIENGNDPVLDTAELQKYMDKWDGNIFLQQLNLNQQKNVLEIGCGTGRILNKILANYKEYNGIDLSQKTVEKAKERFNFSNVNFICGDFITHEFNQKFDVIYSTLTFMHIKKKAEAICKVYSLLNLGGRFVLSIDKNQSKIIDTGYSKIKIFPDNPQKILDIFSKVGFKNIKQTETDLAYIFSAEKL